MAVVLLALLAFALSSNPLGGGTTPAAPAAEGEPAADAPADPGVAEPPAEEPPAQDFPTLLSGMDVDESTRSDLLKTYEQAAASAAEGEPEKAAEKAGELSQDVAELVADGEMAASDGQALTTALVTTFGPLPESGGDNGRGNDRNDDD